MIMDNSRARTAQQIGDEKMARNFHYLDKIEKAIDAGCNSHHLIIALGSMACAIDFKGADEKEGRSQILWFMLRLVKHWSSPGHSSIAISAYVFCACSFSLLPRISILKR